MTAFEKLRRKQQKEVNMDMTAWLEDLAAAYWIEPSELIRRYLKSPYRKRIWGAGMQKAAKANALMDTVKTAR